MTRSGQWAKPFAHIYRVADRRTPAHRLASRCHSSATGLIYVGRTVTPKIGRVNGGDIGGATEA